VGDGAIFTCVAQVWGEDRVRIVAGIAFNDCTPESAVRARLGANITIGRVQRYTYDMTLLEALDVAEREYLAARIGGQV